MSRGHWVATRESRHPGYHVPRLIVPGTDLSAIVKASRAVLPHEVQAFYNNDLGEAWQAADAGITEEEVLRACSFGADRGDVAGAAGRAGGDGRRRGLVSRNLNASVQRVNLDGSRDALWIGELAELRAGSANSWTATRCGCA